MFHRPLPTAIRILRPGDQYLTVGAGESRMFYQVQDVNDDNEKNAMAWVATCVWCLWCIMYTVYTYNIIGIIAIVDFFIVVFGHQRNPGQSNNMIWFFGKFNSGWAYPGGSDEWK